MRRLRLRVKEVLRERGLSIAWLSRELGVSYMSVWNVVNMRRLPRLSTLMRIAEVLGVSVKDLIDEW